MLSPLDVILVTALLLDGGTAAPSTKATRASAKSAVSRSAQLKNNRETSTPRPVQAETDAGITTPQPVPSEVDAGTTISPPSGEETDAGIPPVTSQEDAGTVVPRPPIQEQDAGSTSAQSISAGGVHWPDDVRPLATLDGAAVLAAQAALQQVLARAPKEYAGTCSWSPKAMEVIVGQEGELYFVRINRRVDKCGHFAPSSHVSLDWFELYAVSPEGQVLARYPYSP